VGVRRALLLTSTLPPSAAPCVGVIFEEVSATVLAPGKTTPHSHSPADHHVKDTTLHHTQGTLFRHKECTPHQVLGCQSSDTRL
jgi:hypothetical protein